MGRLQEIMKKDFKKHKAKFQRIDNEIEQERLSKEEKEKKAEAQKWKAMIASLRSFSAEVSAAREVLLGRKESKKDFEIHEEVVEVCEHFAKRAIKESELRQILDAAE